MRAIRLTAATLLLAAVSTFGASAAQAENTAKVQTDIVAKVQVTTKPLTFGWTWMSSGWTW